MPKEKGVSEAERLDRIEHHIQQLAEASTALQRELKIARELAAIRRRAVQPHESANLKRPRKKQR